MSGGEQAFDPLVAEWFAERFGAPTPPQAQGWSAIAAGHDTLVSAPTGSGKTLAAFLWAIDRLVRRARTGILEDRTSVVYVSPLKALANDIQRNLEEPLAAIRARAETAGITLPSITVAVRSGDTPAYQRQAMTRRPPHILITTPESFYILLTAEKSRRMLATAETVIVDEIHAVAGDKRGAHLALSLERLDALTQRPVQRIGLSATQKPIQEVARLLVGGGRVDAAGNPNCTIVDTGHRRAMDLGIETTDFELGPIASHELWADIYDRITRHVAAHRTTIVFVNTRRLVERVAHQLSERLGDDRVVAHHGSLARRIRLTAERKLKSGEVPVVVATASLELGIDVGHVDLVCHVGAPRALATLLQRVGRSGHWLGSVPKGIFFPLTRDDLVQTAAAVRAISQGNLDRLTVAPKPLDILAQQLVALAASEEDIAETDAWALVRRAYPYHDLRPEEFEDVVTMLSEGVSTRRGRRSAHLHRDRVHGRLRGRRGARLAAMTSGGAIPDTADYDVVEEPTGARVGKVNEDFAIESMGGDIFLLGNHSWRIRRVESGTVRVEDAGQTPPTIPFWLGEAPARTAELSAAVSDLREEVATRLPDRAAAMTWLISECRVDEGGAEQITDYLRSTIAALGAVPTCHTIVAERFFDESGGMQLVLHSPFGGRVNRAWGLALRKRFCVTFDFELQAAATDDGVVISLGEQHSFPLESVFSMVRATSLTHDVIQAVLPSPMFTNRWRWNATRALTLLRHMGGKRVPMAIQRMRSEDLLAAVFPAQLACADNRSGPIEPPAHPLVDETIRNCLHEAMDVEGLRTLIEAIEQGRLRTVAVETPTPSPIAHEILNANPYAFLDDAPLEERRARAVSLRRTDPDLADGMGALDPEAIAEVRAQAWPDVRDADELHDTLLDLIVLPDPEGGAWTTLADDLCAVGRAARIRWTVGNETRRGLVAAERTQIARSALGDARLETPLPLPPGSPQCDEPDDAVVAMVRGWLEAIGPTTRDALAQRLGSTPAAVGSALARLEAEGIVLRGRFATEADEWCERRLLARIHRLTLGRLRREIEPVSAADFMRHLLRWQHLFPGTQLHGRDGVHAVITQLHGLELPAPAWEASVLPARVQGYDPSWLDELCLAGVLAWGRFSAPAEQPEPSGKERRRPAPTRVAPLSLALRDEVAMLWAATPRADGRRLSGGAESVVRLLEREGASFLGDVARATGLLPTEAEDALWELVARGLVTGDGFAGLRALLAPADRPRPERRLRALRGGRTRRRALPIGRWSLLRPPAGEDDVDHRAEAITRQLLRRYGVLFRELLARESLALPWRTLLATLRRLEARGEVRGGRFVAGLVGEQYALPEAVDALRATRRADDRGQIAVVSATDPLNLAGILMPGPRVSPLSGHVLAFEEGILIESGELGTVRSRLRGRATAPGA